MGLPQAVTLTETIEERKNADLKGYAIQYNNVITNPQFLKAYNDIKINK